MIDLHCHILPGVDDGSRNLEESVEMARLAVASGVRGIAATSHFRGEERELPKIPLLCERFDLLQKTLNENGIPLKLFHGAEILGLPETSQMAERRLLPTLGEGNYVLIEFYFDEPGEMIDQRLDLVARCGYRIVVAHPERYDAVKENPDWIHRWFDRGYAIQVNKGSVLGRFGSRVRHTAEEILSMGAAHILASDAHRSDIRTTHMAEIRNWACENLGEQYSRILLEENPARVLLGRPLAPIT